MSTTDIAPAQVKYRYWVTEAAANSFRNYVNPPEGEDISAFLVDLVNKAVEAGKTENILDEGEEARIVHINEEPSLFALLKISNNPQTADFAAVTVLLGSTVEKKYSTGIWKRHGGMSAKNRAVLASIVPVKKISEPLPPPSVRDEPRKDLYLIMYKSVRDGGKHQFMATSDDVDDLLNGITSTAMAGSIEVFRKVEIGLHVIV